MVHGYKVRLRPEIDNHQSEAHCESHDKPVLRWFGWCPLDYKRRRKNDLSDELLHLQRAVS